MRRSFRIATWTALGLLCAVARGAPAAEEGPRPPCDAPTLPAPAAVDVPAAVTVWQSKDLPGRWVPPRCLHWAVRDFAVLIAVSGRIGGISGYRDLLRRLSTTHQVAHIRYWSFSRKRWRQLFLEIHALDGPDPERRRPDFLPEEIRTGKDYFVWQKENSLASGMVFRNRVLELSANRLVLQQVNITPSRAFFVEILGAKKFETVAFLEHEKGDVWRYYSLSRVGDADNVPEEAEIASLVNRLVAGFRYLAGVPADRYPPAMR